MEKWTVIGPTTDADTAMQNRREQTPRYGWTIVDLFDLSVTRASPDTARVERPAGLSRASLSARIEAGNFSGTGTVSIVLEGSNTGDVTNAAEWEEIATLNNAQLFSSDDQERLLGAAFNIFGGYVGEGQVSIGRYRFLRARSFVVSETVAVDYTISMRLTGIAGDGEQMLRSSTLTLVSAAVLVFPTSAPFRRPEGTRFLTGQVLLTDVNLDPPGSDGFVAVLQGAVSQAAADAGEWFTMDQTPLLGLRAIGDSQFFRNGQIDIIDMGPFEILRIATTIDAFSGTPTLGPLSRFTMDTVLAFDDNDWIDGSIGFTDLNENLQEMFLGALFTDIGPAGDPREITLQLIDINSQPITHQRTVGVVVSDDPFGGTFAPAASATITAVADVGGTGSSIVFGSGTAITFIRTDTSGQARITVASGGGGGVFISAHNFVPVLDDGAMNPDEIFSPGQSLISTQRVGMTF